MQRRAGFTLIEMIVALTLTLFIMIILSQAFLTGLETFRQLRGLGDMQESLRIASLRLQSDLRADHFEGGRKLSDSQFWVPFTAYGDDIPLSNTSLIGSTRMGFFRIVQQGASVLEGTDLDGLPSKRAIDHAIHFSIRLRGNHREGFLSANLSQVPNPPSPLLTLNTTLGNQPADARFQDQPNTYTSAWGEIGYFLVLQGTTDEPNNPGAATGTKLYRLYRFQKVVVPDTTAINALQIPVGPNGSTLAAYGEISCQADPTGTFIVFNSPVDLANGQRSVKAYTPALGASSVLSNVISFDVQILPIGYTGLPYTQPPPLGVLPNGLGPFFIDVPTPVAGTPGIFDTQPLLNPWIQAGNAPYLLSAIQINLRVWDNVTQQARQVTFVQDL
jgi:prepilin-type N-terminal cleavage/methylation domain-containing protein